MLHVPRHAHHPAAEVAGHESTEAVLENSSDRDGITPRPPHVFPGVADDNTPLGQALAGLEAAAALFRSIGQSFEEFGRICTEAAESMTALHQELKEDTVEEPEGYEDDWDEDDDYDDDDLTGGEDYDYGYQEEL